jgi:hypothetical protein
MEKKKAPKDNKNAKTKKMSIGKYSIIFII